jgi:hypothetical protein
MKIVIPAQDVSIQAKDGTIDPIWYGKLKSIEAFVNLFSEVDPAALTNGQVLIWDSTKKKFTPGAN